MNRRYLLFTLPILSLLWLASTIFIAGHFYPGYSQVSQFISELAATGSPYGGYVNYLGFIPAELLILAFALMSYSVLPRTRQNIIGLIFIVIYGVSLGVAAIFPCDFECQPVPTLSHNIHMASALPGYLSGIIAILLISSGSKSWAKSARFKFSGYIMAALALLAFCNLNPNSDTVGLNQRILELSIYLWFIYLGYSLSQNFFVKTAKVHS